MIEEKIGAHLNHIVCLNLDLKIDSDVHNWPLKNVGLTNQQVSFLQIDPIQDLLIISRNHIVRKGIALTKMLESGSLRVQNLLGALLRGRKFEGYNFNGYKSMISGGIVY